MIKQQGANKTVLFSSHILQEVEAICDRVIIINKGELVADDKLSNLSKNTNASTTVMLEIKETVDEAMFTAAFGNEVSRTNPTTWKFKTVDPERLKKKILELTLKNNLNIASLKSETHNLEDVFRNLTAK